MLKGRGHDNVLCMDLFAVGLYFSVSVLTDHFPHTFIAVCKLN